MSNNLYQKLFSAQEDVFKVIANQKRLEIIQLLSNRELTVTEMITMLGLRQANLSQHLAQLRQSGIVSTRRQGIKIYYQLTDSRIASACDLVKSFLRNQQEFGQEVENVTSDQDDVYPIVQDVVCGMRISKSRAGEATYYRGETLYFCASGCRQKFDEQPSKYIKEKEGIHGAR